MPDLSHLVVGPDEVVLAVLPEGTDSHVAYRLANQLQALLGADRSLVMVGDVEMKAVRLEDPDDAAEST